jgi:hypothetical protein
MQSRTCSSVICNSGVARRSNCTSNRSGLQQRLLQLQVVHVQLSNSWRGQAALSHVFVDVYDSVHITCTAIVPFSGFFCSFVHYNKLGHPCRMHATAPRPWGVSSSAIAGLACLNLWRAQPHDSSNSTGLSPFWYCSSWPQQCRVGVGVVCSSISFLLAASVLYTATWWCYSGYWSKYVPLQLLCATLGLAGLFSCMRSVSSA